MKAFHTLLLAVACMLGLNQLHAQCVSYNTSTQALNAQFNAYLFDSSAIVGSTYFWEFGDGDTSQSFEPAHTYDYSGTYNACFHYYSAGCNYDTCFDVTVDSCNFNPYLGYGYSGTSVNFIGYNVPAGSSYYWTYYSGAGFVDSSTNAGLTFTPTSSGSYYVHLMITTPTGCFDTTSASIYLQTPCSVNIQAYPTSAGSTEIQFSGSPLDSSGVNTYSYMWEFGDGSTSTTSNPVHDYGAYGNYTVCVAVWGNGCSDSVCQPITVSPPYYEISGGLAYSGSGNCSSKVLLITDTSGYLSLINEYSAFVDSSCTGNYFFYVPAGTYYLKGVLNATDPNYANYLPTYYGDELLWGDATPVVVSNSSITNLNINLIAGTNPGGPGFVGGWVTQGAGLAIGGNNEHRGIGDPLPNIQINLLTDNDVPVAYTYTDANGRYTFNNLALGTYKVYAEEINKVPSSMNVTLTANNPSQDNVDVSINSSTAVTGLNDLFDMHVEGLFPNPATDKSVLTVSLKQNTAAQMRIVDLKGSILSNENLKLNTGTNRIDINLANQPAGVYFISLTTNTGKKVMRVAKS